MRTSIEKLEPTKESNLSLFVFAIINLLVLLSIVPKSKYLRENKTSTSQSQKPKKSKYKA